jgi:hypothetical protein
MLPSQRPLVADSNKIRQLLSKSGFGDAAIAGIMGNIEVETGGSFDPQQKQYSGGPGRGLFQMESGEGKLDEYQTWLKKTGRTDSDASQIQFFRDTIYDPSGVKDIVGVDVAGFGNAEKLREVFETDDPAKIAEAVSNLWEKPGVPHTERRKEAASKYMEEDTTSLLSRLNESIRSLLGSSDDSRKLSPADQAQFSDLMSRLSQQGK